MRLVTRGDVDGLMCAVLLKAAGIVDEIVQVHPKDVQDGLIEVTANDIVCNLPWAEGCGMWFDHHSSEETPARLPESFEGRYGKAPSAARLVYEYYVAKYPELKRFESLLAVVDRFDSANLTVDDIKRPEPAMLLAFVLDPRTGLGYYHGFRISNREMTHMIPDLLVDKPIDEVLEMPDVKERVERYWALNEEAARVYGENSRVEGDVLITDLRGVTWIPPANRFLVYTLSGHEGTNISIRLSMAKSGERVSFQVGHNIFNRTSRVDVGELMAAYGGGGHRGAGTCQIPAEDAERVLAEMLGKMGAG